MTKERINEIEDRPIESPQTKNQTESKRTEHSRTLRTMSKM